MSRSVDPSVLLAWNVLSFFASDAEQQRSAVGGTSINFFPEADYLDPDANYLLGLHAVLVMTWGAFFDENELLEHTVLVELKELLDLMYWGPSKQVWHADSLSSSPLWRLVRRLARATLAEAGLPPMFPLERIRIEDYIDAPDHNQASI